MKSRWMLGNIKKSGGRAAGIIENMLGFARKSEEKVSLHSITDLLDSALSLATNDYDLKNQYDFKLIRIRKKYEKRLPKLMCDGNEIQQVFLNILFNAAQAMKSVETQNPLIVIRVRLEKAHKIMRIAIEDNGPGMGHETLKRIFEPFFTTKPVGLGTGLGLSVSYYIITENHGGKLEVKSEPEKGSRFIIRIPVDKTDS